MLVLFLFRFWEELFFRINCFCNWCFFCFFIFAFSLFWRSLVFCLWNLPTPICHFHKKNKKIDDVTWLSLDEKPVIFRSAKNFRYFFRFRWYGRKWKCHNNFSFILPAEKKTRFAMQKFYFLWYFNYFLTNKASCKKNIWKSKKKFGRIYGR